MPSTRSENLVPRAIRRSLFITPRLEVLVPCIPSIPVYLSLVLSNAPLPISESHTGASISDANSKSSFSALDATHPPPTNIIGRFEALIASTAALISFSDIFSVLLVGIYFSFFS